MTPQERQRVDDLFDRLAGVEGTPRDPDAASAIEQGLRKAPNAVYALVQTVLIQDEALKRANSRIQELETASASPQNPSGEFLNSMRATIFEQNQPRGSVPNVRPPEMAGRPVWNSGQVMQQTQPLEQSYQVPYGQPYGAPQTPPGGGSFLGAAAATAAGIIGGSLLLGSIRSMMGGGHNSFGDLAMSGSKDAGQNSRTDQSGSNLARDAGINDIDSPASHADGTSRAGLFDTASNEENDNDIDLNSGDFGGDEDNDYA